MEYKAIYTKPVWRKKLIYFLLLLYPVFILFMLSAGLAGITTQFELSAKSDLMNERDKAMSLTFNILYERLNAPNELITQLDFPKDQGKIDKLVKDYPEIVQVNLLKDNGNNKTLFSSITSKAIHDTIINSALAIFDTCTKVNTRLSVFPDSSFNFKISTLEQEGNNYLLTFNQKGDEIRLVVTDLDKIVPLLPGLFADARDHYRQFYEDYFTQSWARDAIQIKFYDSDNENIFTFGMSSNKVWDEIRELEHPLFPWRMTFQLFPNDRVKTLLAGKADINKVKFPNFQWIIIRSIILPLICIVLLGHFSPRLHGFKLTKEK